MAMLSNVTHGACLRCAVVEGMHSSAMELELELLSLVWDTSSSIYGR